MTIRRCFTIRCWILMGKRHREVQEQSPGQANSTEPRERMPLLQKHHSNHGSDHNREIKP